jgi:hypothetical protein
VNKPDQRKLLCLFALTLLAFTFCSKLPLAKAGTLISTFTMDDPTGTELHLYDLILGGDGYLYAYGHHTIPPDYETGSCIYKINPSTMTLVDYWDAKTGEWADWEIGDFVYQNGYIYVLVGYWGEHPEGSILKLDPSTMSIVASGLWDYYTLVSCATDGTLLYVVGENSDIGRDELEIVNPSLGLGYNDRVDYWYDSVQQPYRVHYFGNYFYLLCYDSEQWDNCLWQGVYDGGFGLSNHIYCNDYDTDLTYWELDSDGTFLYVNGHHKIGVFTINLYYVTVIDCLDYGFQEADYMTPRCAGGLTYVFGYPDDPDTVMGTVDPSTFEIIDTVDFDFEEAPFSDGGYTKGYASCTDGTYGFTIARQYWDDGEEGGSYDFIIKAECEAPSPPSYPTEGIVIPYTVFNGEVPVQYDFPVRYWSTFRVDYSTLTTYVEFGHFVLIFTDSEDVEEEPDNYFFLEVSYDDEEEEWYIQAYLSLDGEGMGSVDGVIFGYPFTSNFTVSLDSITGNLTLWLDDEEVGEISAETGSLDLNYVYGWAWGENAFVSGYVQITYNIAEEIETIQGLDLIWVNIENGDLIGFFIACFVYAWISPDLFFGVLAMLFLVPLYIRTKSVMLICILWILIGSILIVAMPLVSGIAVLFLVLGIGGMLWKLTRPSGYG